MVEVPISEVVRACFFFPTEVKKLLTVRVCVCVSLCVCVDEFVRACALAAFVLTLTRGCVCVWLYVCLWAARRGARSVVVYNRASLRVNGPSAMQSRSLGRGGALRRRPSIVIVNK